eukprot:4306529-Prymnesium_polylepis.1
MPWARRWSAARFVPKHREHRRRRGSSTHTRGKHRVESTHSPGGWSQLWSAKRVGPVTGHNGRAAKSL